MKRDMELIRKILFETEKLSVEESGGTTLEIEGYDQQIVSYHIMLLDEAGLIKGIDFSGGSNISWFVDRLTWDGYEFLEASRNEQIWKRTITTITNKGGGLVFEVLKQVLINTIKEAILGGIKLP